MDESGDFEKPEKPWIVGGALVPMDRVNAEKRLGDIASLCLAEFDIKDPGDVHLTDIAKRLGNEVAVKVATRLLGMQEARYVEPYRGCRRLVSQRDWSHDNETKTIFSRSQSPRRSAAG